MAARLPSLNWLRVFEAAARTESFARAASELNLSAAAVSQQVKALESQLGTPPFRRHAHSVSLTEAGRVYLPAVQQSLVMLQSATTGLFGGSREQRLYVQSVLLFSTGVLAPGLAGFHAANPTISLVLSSGKAEMDFADRFADLQIVFGGAALFSGDSDRLFGETLFPVAPPGVAASTAQPRDLLDHRLIETAPQRVGWPQVLECPGVVSDPAPGLPWPGRRPATPSCACRGWCPACRG